MKFSLQIGFLFLCANFLSGCASSIQAKFDSISFLIRPDIDKEYVYGDSEWKGTSKRFIENYDDGSGFFEVTFSTTSDLEKIVTKNDFSPPFVTIYNCKFGDAGGNFISEVYFEGKKIEKSKNLYFYSFLFPVNFNLVNLAFQNLPERSAQKWSKYNITADKICFILQSGNMLGRSLVSNEIIIPIDFISNKAIFFGE